MDTVTKSKVVDLHFTLKNDGGKVLDSSKGQDPLTYLHGHRNLIPGLEKALEGSKVGDKKKVTLKPEEAYGPVDQSLKIIIPKNQFPADEKISAGMQFQGTNDAGQTIVFIVEDIKGEDVYVDGNHPLAGQTLHFEVEVIDIRDSTEEERAHGHAHGPDGHHHH